MTVFDRDRINELVGALGKLTDQQLDLIESIVAELSKPYTQMDVLAESDVFTRCLLENLGDAMRLHHTCFSKEPFGKYRFEYAMERLAGWCGLEAKLAPKGNPGRDITINGRGISAKTEAARGIRANEIHISKFMELGSGAWSDRIEDLEGLRQQFLSHLESYELICVLRCLHKQHTQGEWYYEFVEIPKGLLEEARTGVLEYSPRSTTNPKSGHCRVKEDTGELKFQLYFDGGGERKLQIQKIGKDYCIVRARWVFTIG